jgi:hypothetical protein
MLTAAADDIPVRVHERIGREESHLATLHGLLESGMTLTDRGLFAWRATGVSGPLPLRAIERLLVDTGAGSDHLDVLVLPRQAIHAPLVLTLRANELDKTVAFVERLVVALGTEPRRETLGPVLRLSFQASEGTVAGP